MTKPWYEQSFGADYVARYAHRDPEEARRAVANLAPMLELAGATVLDLACGAGRLIAPLLAAGAAHVIGIDLSPDLLAEANKQLAGEIGTGRVRLIRADMRHIPIEENSLDAAVNFFTSFGYFEDESDDARVLAGIFRGLRPGKKFAHDFLNATAAVRDLVAEDSVTLHGETLVQRRQFDPATRRIEKQVFRADGRVAMRESVRAYSADELTALGASVGFEMVARIGDYDAAPFDAETSPRCITIWQKPV